MGLGNYEIEIGKSHIAIQIARSTQRMGGIVVYIDTENACNTEFLEAIGIDIQKMLYVPLESVEDIFEAIDSIIESVRGSDKKKLANLDAELKAIQKNIKRASISSSFFSALSIQLKDL